jgi:hypothetical protein
MSMTLRPDPDRPAGGFAVLSLPAAAALPAEVTVDIMETFGGRWLAPSASDAASGRIAVGEANWQPVAHGFGPYPLRKKGDRVELTLGPEIVNKIDGYTSLRLVVGGIEGQVTWPDDIMPLEGALGGAGLQVGRKAATAAAPAVMPTLRADAPTGPQPPVTPPPMLPDPAVDDGTAPKNAALRWGLALALLALAGGGIWYALQEPVPPPVAVVAPEPVHPEPVPDEPAPEPEPVSEPEAVAEPDCSRAALAAGPPGLSALRAAMTTCGSRLSADDAMALLEDAISEGDASALLVMGKLYDPAAEDPDFEAVAGLTLGDAPPLAAEYYSRARSAGDPEAAALLAATCTRLASADDDLSVGANHDFCS